ncbi:hypothetical protein CR513_31475, partial [Mucuna pruriens]
MQALEQSGTWELVFLPPSKKAIGCRWLVAKGYTQVYGLDYGDSFSPVAKITTICLLLAMATIRHWPFHQLNIKNAFLHGDLDEEIYMEQPPGFVAQGESGLVCKLHRSLYGLKQFPRAWFGKFSQVVQNFGMTRSEADHSIFYCHSSSSKCVYLVVYVDDITKDLGHLKYFLGIEVAQSKEGIVISQRKYALDILQETSMSNCTPVDSPIDPNLKLMVKHGEPYSDLERYRRLVGKLIYLTITRPEVSFAVGVVTVLRTYLDRVYYMRIRETPIYQVIVMLIVMLIGQDLPLIDDLLQIFAYLLGEMWSLGNRLFTLPLILYFMREPNIEIDCHFVREKLLAKEISTEFVNSSNQLADIFTKSLRGPQIQQWPNHTLNYWGCIIYLIILDSRWLHICNCGVMAKLPLPMPLTFHERKKHIEANCHFIWEKI